MAVRDAQQFWLRYKSLAKKDFPVLVKTGILQPTLSSWCSKRLFPRADDAVAIAAALNTTVEFLVNGKDNNNVTCSPAAMNIALLADILSDEGLHILNGVAESLSLKHPSNRRKK
jgi:transcriptional regulator with XRE-family HTH domain